MVTIVESQREVSLAAVCYYYVSSCLLSSNIFTHQKVCSVRYRRTTHTHPWMAWTAELLYLIEAIVFSISAFVLFLKLQMCHSR